MVRVQQGSDIVLQIWGRGGAHIRTNNSGSTLSNMYMYILTTYIHMPLCASLMESVYIRTYINHMWFMSWHTLDNYLALTCTLATHITTNVYV